MIPVKPLVFSKQTLLYSLPARYLLGRLVDHSHHRLRRFARDHQAILLNPIPPPTCGGHIEHYYHFLFDLLLPLQRVLREPSHGAKFLLGEFGIFTERLQELFPDRVEITRAGEPQGDLVSAQLVGMNPKHVLVQKSVLLDFRSHVFQSLAIEQEAPVQNVLLIERMPPDPYFISQAVNKGSGTSRRSIVNHNELRETLESTLRPPYQLLNVRLENMSFREQIEAFSSAIAVIGQHGAGLANAIWMNPGSTLIELGSPSKRHFEFISNSMSHQYIRFPTEEDHALIDCERLKASLILGLQNRDWIKAR